ncbi:MAG: hypothetical protein ABI036_13805 [Fibrobacteria bacterium]
MKAIAFAICVCLGAPLARDDSARAPAAKPRPKSKVVDLDFGEDESPAAIGSSGEGASGTRPWVYWALGASAVAAGITWYWLEDRSPTAETERKEQVFTDQRP